jgi:hypothetical protein
LAPWLLSASAACAPASEIAELGVYNRSEMGAPAQDAAVAEDAFVATEDAGTAGAPDAGPPAFGQSPSADRDAASTSAPVADTQPCKTPGCTGGVPTDTDQQVCFSVRAHDPADVNAQYQPGSGSEEYVTVTVRNPEPSARYVRTLLPVIDNGAVLHDMRIYQHHGSLPEGVAVGRAPLRDLSFLFAWWPGSSGLRFEDGVGIPIDSASWLTLEIHYVLNAGSGRPANSKDRSGMKICTTSAPLAFPVSFSRLGSEKFAGMHLEGTCTPTATSPIQILAVLPSPIEDSLSALLYLERSAGARETLYKAPSARAVEELVPTSLPVPVLARGDSLGWSCAYADTPATGEERGCGLQVLHWPAGTLVSDGATASCLK